MANEKSTPSPSFAKEGEQKKAMIAKIKIAQKQLGLDDGAYRDILKRITGKDSSTKLDEKQLEAVINELKGYGFKPTMPKHGRKPRTAVANKARTATMDKIGAILTDMALHWNYAHAIGRGMFGKEQLDFCTDEELFKVMQALAVYQNRKSKQAKTETL